MVKTQLYNSRPVKTSWGPAIGAESKCSVLTLHFPLPSLLGGNYPQACLLTVRQQFSRLEIFNCLTSSLEVFPVSHLPPLVIAGVGDVQNVAVVEAKPSAGQSIVLVRVVLEQRSHVESPLGAGPHQGPRDVLLQLVELRLVPVVLLRLVLDAQHHHAPRTFQGLKVCWRWEGVDTWYLFCYPGSLLVWGQTDVCIIDCDDLISPPKSAEINNFIKQILQHHDTPGREGG